MYALSGHYSSPTSVELRVVFRLSTAIMFPTHINVNGVVFLRSGPLTTAFLGMDGGDHEKRVIESHFHWFLQSTDLRPTICPWPKVE